MPGDWVGLQAGRLMLESQYKEIQTLKQGNEKATKRRINYNQKCMKQSSILTTLLETDSKLPERD